MATRGGRETRLLARKGGDRRYRRAMASKKTVDRVQDLVRLAADEATSDNEARTAALTAVRLMQEEGLTVVSAADLEDVRHRIGQARLKLKKAEDKANQKMMLGALGGIVAARFFKP
jgi:hypothetical protein